MSSRLIAGDGEVTPDVDAAIKEVKSADPRLQDVEDATTARRHEIAHRPDPESRREAGVDSDTPDSLVEGEGVLIGLVHVVGFIPD